MQAPDQTQSNYPRWLPPVSNFILALVATLSLTIFAFIQEPHPDAFRVEPNWASWDFWQYPIERNAFRRLPVIGTDLHDIAVSADDSRLWAVGRSSFSSDDSIVYSHDSGKHWQTATIAWPTNGYSQAASSNPSAAQSANAATPDKTATSLQPDSPARRLNSISFIDRNHGWAVGNNGTILSSADGGKTWQAQSSGTSAGLNALQFLDNGQQGWAVGDAGTILSSIDGGKTWQVQSSGTQEWLNAVQFLSDSQRGWAVGSNGTILSSADGGKTWQAQSSGTLEMLNSVQFLDDGKRGWAVGRGGTILSTVDSGNYWQSLSSSTWVGLNKVQFLKDGSQGWAVGDNGWILSSVDGGKSWQAQRSGTQANLDSLQLLNGYRGWAVGRGGTILSSEDGKTWRALSTGSQANLRSVQFLEDGQRGWALAGNSTILTSVDGGNIWQVQSSGELEALNALQFLGDGQRGWAVGSNGTILSSADGGKSWQKQSSGTKGWLNAVQFLGEGMLGWAVGDSGTILSSADGGKTWQAQSSSTQTMLTSVQFLADGQRGWVIGGDGTVLSSDDGGKTWQVWSSAPSRLNSVRFFSHGQRSWAVGSEGTIVSSADDGKSWQSQSSSAKAKLNAVQFLDDGQHGWAVGGDGTILSSADGGKTWQAQSSGTPAGLSAVQFLSDGQRGWAVGYDGSVLSSADGGKTWQDIQYRKMPAPWFWVLIWYLWAWLVVSGRPLLKALAGELGPELTAKKFGIHAVGSSDNPGGPASVDYLGSLQLARDISHFLLNEHTTPPLTLAITGDWGSGKSTVMTYLQAQLRRAGMRPVLYNAWHHQEEQQVLGSILECVRQQATPRWWPWLLPALWFRLRSLLYLPWWLKLPLLSLLVALIILSGHKERQQAVVTTWHDLAEQLNLEKPAFLTGRGYNKLCPAAVSSPDKANSIISTAAVELSEAECRKLVCLVQPELQAPVHRAADCLPAVHFNNDAEFLDAVKLAFGILTDERGQLISAQLEHAGDSNSSLPFWLLTGLAGMMPLILLTIKASSLFGLASTDLLKSAAKTVGLAVPAEPVGTRQIWQSKFQRLTQLMGARTLVLFIDDLDRCQREHAMRVLETLSFLVNAGDLYVILGVAPKYVLANVKLHFEDLAKALHEFDGNGEENEANPSKAKPRNLARFYLQKLINIEVPVPQASSESMHKLLFAEQGEVDSDAQREEKFQKLGWGLILGLQILVASGVMGFAAFYHWPDTPQISQTPLQSNASAASNTATKQPDKPVTTPEPAVPESNRAEKNTATYFRPAPEPWPTEQQLWSGSLAVLGLLGAILAGWLGIRRNPKRWQQWQSRVKKVGKSLRLEFVGAKPLQDSDVFKEALEIWMPLIVADRAGAIHAPRTVRAFLNRLRFLAARWPKEKMNGEAQLVALAALHMYLASDFENTVAIFLLSSAKPDHRELISFVNTFITTHQERFGLFTNEDKDFFAFLISGLEIHKP
ncbi:YCF48-related protein [Methylomonas albis]|uniref:Photosynthesis system II assembly factor Ycf48/Hcf136-like domain-containing protein n=1 Tax=Methylomonas albis TaxID=1854563 RepID=A0ABR9D239_9GAMM|nr:YCF48-related protein [Methylomonas albis]MBD9356871.1 hypothetical protein [Methylomonas albis]